MPLRIDWIARVPGHSIVKRVAIAADRVAGPMLRRARLDPKGIYEFAYWQRRHADEGRLGNRWYEAMFTTGVGLDREFYEGKRILDIGCGPRGSLEWADHAAQRVGLDTLIARYRELGIDEHEMEYVEAGAERIPFDDGHFDVVTSINSLDHVADVGRALDEMTRVLAVGGSLVIVVDVHRRPTIAEPHTIPWDLGARLATDHGYDIVLEEHREKAASGSRMGTPEYDHDDPTDRYGVLVLRALKRRER